MKKIKQISKHGLSFARHAIYVIAMMLISAIANAQYGQIAESFEGATAPAGWFYYRISGTVGVPNAVYQVTAPGTYPTVATAFSGTKMIRYNNRTANYPALSGASNGDAIYYATNPRDWSGRAISGTPNVPISLRFWRDADATGGVQNVGDSMRVYLNITPDIASAVLLTEQATGANNIHRSNTLSPVSVAGWQLLNYMPPTVGSFGGRFDTSSTVYVMFAFFSKGGNNMYIDSVSAPAWQTPMRVTHAELVNQNTNPTAPGVTNVPIISMRVVTKGSLGTIKKLTKVKFLPSGTSNFLNDVLNAKCIYTGTNPVFNPTGNQIPLETWSTGVNLGQLCFGWITANPCTVGGIPAWDTLVPGTENYLHLAYDIKPGATPGNYVDADPDSLVTDTLCPTSYLAFPNTLPGGVLIDVSYPAPTLTAGTSWAGYNNNDFVSGVSLIGANGTQIENWYHDVFCPLCTPIGQNCNRFDCHPDDHTLFVPNGNPGGNVDRFVQLFKGQGIRTGTPAYTLKVQCGTWFSANYVAGWIDWNKDGDFTDFYTGANGVINEWCNYTGAFGNNTSGAYPGVSWGLAQANMVNPWTGSWATYSINVPDPVDLVNGVAPTPATAVKLGGVRMRIREVYATSNINPFQNGYTWGETEDYTVTVIDLCPAIGSNVCKWIGNTTRWDDPQNWCPAKPTLNDIAIISASSVKMPTIDSGTVAVCRSLKIENGAAVNIDCQYSTGLVNDPKGSLRVADSLIIGVGTITASSQLKVNSNFSGNYTIPAASAVPPAGSGFTPQTPFQIAPNLKIQIAYTADELRNVFGWRVGDQVDSIRFVFKSTTGAAVTYPQFRIVKWEVSSPVAWTNPMTAGIDVAVRSGFLGVTSGPSYVVGNSTSGVTVSMNLPNNGISFMTLPVNSFFWNGNNMVLSFEFFHTNTGGMGNYILYNEASGIYNVLELKSNTGAATWNNTNSGYALTGYGKSLIGANGNITSTGGIAANCASNQRPRLMFFNHRPYTRFPITIGKAFVNNNPYIKVGGSVVGDSGFVAGKSKVTFDPTIRSTVNSPGLASTNTWNPTVQTALLSATADTMSITSGRYALGGTGYAVGTASTVFNELEIKANSNIALAAATVKQRLNTYADTLTMTSGELNLNRKMFTLKNGYATALVSAGGWIRSEDNSNGNIQSIFRWKTTSNDDYSVPFGKSSTSIFPLKIYPEIAGGMGDIDMATYGTAAPNNAPFPIAPTLVTTMNDTMPVANVATDWTVDRFWYIRSYGTSKSNNDSVVFSYPETEGTVDAFYKTGVMKAQRYSKSTATGNWGWNHWSFFEGQRDWSNGIISNVKAVSGTGAGTIPGPNLGSASDSGFIWTIVQWGAGQAPLPIELISFNAKQVDQKVKVWWDVQSETAVAKYIVERTTDYSFITEVASQLPVGPSTSVLHYEDWDMNPLKGMQYYRLKTLSIDGTKQFSQYVPVNLTNSNFAIISGSTADETRFVFDQNGSIQYNLYDANGKKIISGMVNANPGINVLSLPNLSGGMYFLNLSDGHRTISTKIVK